MWRCSLSCSSEPAPSVGGSRRCALGVSVRLSQMLVIGAAVLVSSPFWVGLIRVTRFLGLELAAGRCRLHRVGPTRPTRRGGCWWSRFNWPLSFWSGAPLLAITQPFVPPLQGAIILLLLLTLLSIVFWRRATNLQGHARAAAQIIAEAIAQSTRDGRAATDERTDAAAHLLSGLGAPTPVHLDAESSAVGRTLSQINLRGRTGATVLAIGRRRAMCCCLPVGRFWRPGTLSTWRARRARLPKRGRSCPETARAQ